MGFVDALADPAHDWHRHRVAQCLVSRPVRALIGGFVSPGDEGVVVGETLKAFAFCGGNESGDTWRIRVHLIFRPDFYGWTVAVRNMFAVVDGAKKVFATGTPLPCRN